ncbi:MAG: hypothetical protein WA160_13295 [Pseudobdellovibrio sp.]
MVRNFYLATRWLLITTFTVAMVFSSCAKKADTTAVTSAGVFPSSLGYTQPAGIK